MTFKGGIHPDYNKKTSAKPIEVAKLPEKIILPLQQHIGCEAAPIVKVGDLVKTGQLVAEAKVTCSANIHSSISGTVKAIEKLPHPTSGIPTQSIVIESDDKDTKIDMKELKESGYNKLPAKKLLELIQSAGIVGMGGACFPTHVKLSPPKDKPIDTLIINGAECEPYLTTDHRMMVEKTEQIIEGIKIIKKILNPKHIIIGIEKNKPDAIKEMEMAVLDTGIRVIPLAVKYPQGAEKMLIYSLTKRKVPAGGLPMDVGCVVQNIGTTFAIYEAVAKSKPLYERIITVTGKVTEPKNLLVRNGTSVEDLIKQVGGYYGTPKKILNGGPMMGIAMPNDSLPITKGTSGILVFNKDDIQEARMPIECIRCGKCVKDCPMDLCPSLIAKYSEKAKFKKAEEFFAMDCIECGCCSFNCPSHIPLLHWIRQAKNMVSKDKKKTVCQDECN